MRLFSFSLLLGACAALAQVTAPPPPPADEPPPDTVVASFEGKKLTYGDMKKFLSVLPQAQQQAAMRDRKTFVHEYFLMQHLAEMAEKEKLDETSPVKETLDFNRRLILMNAKLNDVANRMTVDEEDVKKFYETNKDKYSQVKLKVLYIAFSNNPQGGTGVQKPLTEEEAKAKIEKILAEIRGGADFVKMVKRYSEDKTSAAKDGDFGAIRKSDNIPDAIRAVVFSLKPGEVGGPVRQPNGFYLFRAEEVTARTYQQVQIEIYEQVRQAKYQQWMAKLNGSVDFKVENENFFKAPAPVAAPAPAAAPQILPVK
jgi:peptidyl-prolyl cis-trans isomerase C